MFFAVPYRWNEGWSGKNTVILDYAVEHPQWAGLHGPAHGLRRLAAAGLVDPANYILEIWDDGQFVGLAMASRIVPSIDCLFHFFFVHGTQLFRGVSIIRQILSHLFERLDLQRISMEVPDGGKHNAQYLRFLRQRLGFRFEGEVNCYKTPLAQGLVRNKHVQDEIAAGVWLAKFGARRELSHWDGERYRDILLLRLLRQEHQSRTQPALAVEPERLAARPSYGYDHATTSSTTIAAFSSGSQLPAHLSVLSVSTAGF